MQNALYAPQPCMLILQQQTKMHTRHCPEPDLVNSYLTTICIETSALTASSTICNHCYKLFSNVVLQLKHSKVVFEQAKPTSSMSSMYTSMESVVSELSSHENSITSRCGMITVIGVGKGGQGGHCPLTFHNLFWFFLRHNNKYYDNSEHGKYVPSFARCMHTCYSLTVLHLPPPPPPPPPPLPNSFLHL